VPEFSSRQVSQALEGKLRAQRTEKTKHYGFTVRDDDGVVVGMTVISHGSHQIGDNLIRAMSKQLNVPGRSALLRDVISCTASRDDYLAAVQR
jgi:hypothetical protein